MDNSVSDHHFGTVGCTERQTDSLFNVIYDVLYPDEDSGIADGRTREGSGKLYGYATLISELAVRPSPYLFIALCPGLPFPKVQSHAYIDRNRQAQRLHNLPTLQLVSKRLTLQWH